MTVRADALERQAADLAARAAALRGAATAVAKGNDGEEQVERRLDVLDGSGWHVLHDRRKDRRSPANLDHVVVGPAGVLVIDAKNWTGGLLRLDDRGMRMGRWRKDDALHACRADADLVRRIARETVPDVHVVGVLAFVQDVGLTGPVMHQGVVACQQDQVLPWLAGLPRLLTVDQVDRLAAHLRAALPARTATPTPDRATSGTRKAVSLPEQWVPPASNAGKTAKAGRQQERKARKRADARRELRNGALRLAVFAAVVFTLPTTMPIMQDRVIAPLAERFVDGFADNVAPQSP